MIKIIALIVDSSASPLEDSIERYEATKDLSDEEWAKHESPHLEKRVLFTTTSNQLYILPRAGEVIHHDKKDYFVYQVLWGTSESDPVELNLAFLLLKEVDLSDFNRKRTVKGKRGTSKTIKNVDARKKDDIIFDINKGRKDIN